MDRLREKDKGGGDSGKQSPRGADPNFSVTPKGGGEAHCNCKEAPAQKKAGDASTCGTGTGMLRVTKGSQDHPLVDEELASYLRDFPLLFSDDPKLNELQEVDQDFAD